MIVHAGAAVGPGFTANLHVALASPNACFVEYVLAPDNIRQRMLTEPIRLVDGFVERPTEPGLWISLGPVFVEQHPYRQSALEYA